MGTHAFHEDEVEEDETGHGTHDLTLVAVHVQSDTHAHTDTLSGREEQLAKKQNEQSRIISRSFGCVEEGPSCDAYKVGGSSPTYLIYIYIYIYIITRIQKTTSTYVPVAQDELY